MSKIQPDVLRKKINEIQGEFACPAISVAVIEDGKITFAEGFGTRTLGKTEPVNADTSYAIASMSKSTVSTALAMLHEQKAFCWNDPVTKFLPDFRLYDPFASQEIRVIDLLIHNCGLNSESAGTLWYGSDYSREEVVRRLRFLRPVSGFRSQFAYQNVCYLVAGQVIRAICGQSWDDFISENIFQPLGMTRSFPTIAALRASGIDNVATPHTMLKDQLTIIPYRDHDNVGPAASVHSTTRDLCRYLSLFLGHGSANGKQLLKPESVEFLHQPQILFDQAENLKAIHPRLNAQFPAYGLGWFVQDYCGKKRVGHSGGVDGMRGRMEMLPRQNAGVAVLTNSEDRRAYMSVVHTVLDMLLGVEPVDWVSAWKNDPEASVKASQPVRQAGTHPSLSLAGYAGTYQDSAYGDLRVTAEPNGLTLRFTHTPAFTADLEHWHYDTFRLHWRDPYIPDGFVTFSLGSDGSVRALHLDQPRLLDVDFTEMDEWIRKVN